MKRIPITPEALDDTFSVQLGDHKLQFRFRWSEQMQSWWLDLIGLTVDLKILGSRLSPGSSYLGRHRPSLGELFILGPEHEQITFGGLGTTHQMYWASKEEIDAL